MKTLHFTTQHASDSIYMPITVWGIGGFWTMEDNAMACEPLVQPSKDGNELLKRQVQTRCSTPTWLNTVNEAVRSITAMQTRWRSSPSSLCWFHTRITAIAACPVRAAMSRNGKSASRRTTFFAPFECTHLLILRPFSSARHTCTSFHVSTLFGSSALTEQGITLTLLVIQETSLLGLCVCHLSENVINYWWYTGLHISQVWSNSDHSAWVLHFS